MNAFLVALGLGGLDDDPLPGLTQHPKTTSQLPSRVQKVADDILDAPGAIPGMIQPRQMPAQSQQTGLDRSAYEYYCQTTRHEVQ